MILASFDNMGFVAQYSFMYFNYHAKVRKLIEDGHCLGFEFFAKYHEISPCLLLYFDNDKPMPIREHKFDEYLFLLAKYGVEELKKENEE